MADLGHSPSSSPEVAREREATELHDYIDSNSQPYVTQSNPFSGQGRGSQRSSASQSSLKKFWRRHVVATVPHEACRDHFALERTYLSYFRIALALAILGVFIAQLFRLQHTENPDPVLGFFVLGKPLSCICTGAALCVTLLGAYRFWRQQNAMLRGKVQAGGWEMQAIFTVVLAVTVLLLVLVVVVDIRRS